MTSLQLGVKVSWPLFRGGIFCGGDVPLKALGFRLKALVPTQLAVTKASTSNQCNRAGQEATEEPSRTVVAFVSSNVTGVKGAGQPNEKQREQEAHHQSVTAL